MKAKIWQDSDAESPREDDNTTTMVCFHNRYNLGDKDHGYNQRDYNSWTALGRAIERDNPGCVILPIFMYDHSGITIATTPFACQWDSGQIGWAFYKADDIRTNYGVKRVSAKLREAAERAIKLEVEVYDEYLRGNVYGFTIEDDNGNVLESVGGFYGSNPDENGMTDHVTDEQADVLRAFYKAL